MAKSYVVETSKKIELWEDGEHKDLARELLNRLDNSYIRNQSLSDSYDNLHYSMGFVPDHEDSITIDKTIELLLRFKERIDDCF